MFYYIYFQMRILFFNPSADLRLSLGAFRSFYSPIPPLWIGYLGAIAKRYTDDIIAIDNSVERMDLKDAFQSIKEARPDIVCISVLTQTANFSYKLARAIKENLSSFVIMGGPHASYFAKEIIEGKLADAVVVGEGEEVFAKIIENFDIIRENKEQFRIKGAIFSPDQEVTPADRITDLESIPFPAWELLERYFRYYKPPPPIKPAKVLTFLASRGCPYSCNFCMVQLGGRYVIRSPQSICDEVELFYDRYKIGHFLFCDPLFPPSKKRALEILSYMNKRGIQNITSWSTETRADVIDDEVALALRESGCSLVALGIESGSEELLGNTRKNITLEQVKRAVRALKRAGIRVMGLYMLGIPEETEESIKETIKFARSLKTQGAKFAITVPYPGTEIYEKYVKSHKPSFSDDEWDRFSPYTTDPPYKMSWVKIDQSKLFYYQRISHILTNLSLRNVLIYFTERPGEMLKLVIYLLKEFFWRFLISGFFKLPKFLVVLKSYREKNSDFRNEVVR